MKKYNGWTNYETWNVALWIDNDETLLETAKQCTSYTEFANKLMELSDCKTPDGVKWTDERINQDEVNNALFDWRF